MSFGFAHSYELLMSDAMIEVRAFKERTAAARWLEVAVKTVEMSLVNEPKAITGYQSTIVT